MFKSKKNIFGTNKSALFSPSEPKQEDAHVLELKKDTEMIVSYINSTYSHPLERRNIALTLAKMLIQRYLTLADKDIYSDLCKQINKLCVDITDPMLDNSVKQEKKEEETPIFDMELS